LAASAEIINKGDVFNNSGLFSNHYLENMIQKFPEWNDDDAHLCEAYSQIKEIFEKKKKIWRSTLGLIWSTIGSGRCLTNSATITGFRKAYITIL